jgi:hypothetical protein
MIVFIEDANVDSAGRQGPRPQVDPRQELLEDVCARPSCTVDIGAFRPVKIDQFRISYVQQFTSKAAGPQPRQPVRRIERALCRLFGSTSMDGVCSSGDPPKVMVSSASAAARTMNES